MQKQLEKKMDSEQREPYRQRIEERLKQVKREVYTNEDKVALRKKNFEKARFSIGKKVLDEFI